MAQFCASKTAARFSFCLGMKGPSIAVDAEAPTGPLVGTSQRGVWVLRERWAFVDQHVLSHFGYALPWLIARRPKFATWVGPLSRSFLKAHA